MTELDSLWEAIQNSFRQYTGQVTFDNFIAPDDLRKHVWKLNYRRPCIVISGIKI